MPFHIRSVSGYSGVHPGGCLAVVAGRPVSETIRRSWRRNPSLVPPYGP